MIAFFRSTIGQKFLVGISGLGISGFALTHMAGNLLIFKGPEAYNTYGHNLIHMPFFIVAELGLLGMFLMHIGLTVRLVMKNKSAREVSYSNRAEGKKATSFAALTMILSGALMLAFLVLHIATFKYGAYYSVTYNGVEMRDLYRLIEEKFKSPLYSGWYVLCLALLLVHLSHGIKATFQSLGLLSSNHARLSQIGFVSACVIALGFMSQTIFMFLK